MKQRFEGLIHGSQHHQHSIYRITPPGSVKAFSLDKKTDEKDCCQKIEAYHAFLPFVENHLDPCHVRHAWLSPTNTFRADEATGLRLLSLVKC